MLNKKLTATFNIIDPFTQQQSRTVTYGTNFNLESYNTTQTRNYRLTLGYSFTKTQKKKFPVNQKILPKNLQKT
jgi:hypothetical protein